MEQFSPIELEFIRESLKQIESAADGRSFKEPVAFEVVVTQTKKMDGAVKIYVASGQGSVSTELAQKISFTIYPKRQNRLDPEYKVPVLQRRILH